MIPKELTIDGTVTHIIHASDIHIRTGDLERSRYSEYYEQFKTFIDKIPGSDTSVIVLTGDIFHNKGKIEPAGICLAHYLIDGLLEKADVLFICGNHDYRQEDPNIPDAIYSIYHKYFENKIHSKHNAYYLHETGYYRYKNILFSVLDLRDVLKTYNTSGRVEDGIKFPPPIDVAGVDYKIGLFHGFYNNKEIGCAAEFNPQWSGYDFMLLGDLHSAKVYETGKCLWGYSGSLIQQDFGEGFFDHGFLIWNLLEKSTEFVTLFNHCGFCTLQSKGDNQLYMHVKGKKWVNVDELTIFPKKAMMRVLNKDSIPIVKNYCEEHGIVPRSIQLWNGVIEETPVSQSIQQTPHEQLDELNSAEKWLDFLGGDTQYQPFIEKPSHLLIPTGEKMDYGDITKRVLDRNQKISKAIDEFINYCKVETAPRVTLMSMEWSYLMCYGDHNIFDFQKIDGKIALLNGKNAMGKSSFLDVICIGLFGDPTKMRQMVTGKKYSDRIIHTNKPPKTAPFVKLQFKVENDVYEIHRTFGTQSAKENSILQTSARVYKVIDQTKQLHLEGGTLVDRWIEKAVGSMESILMSTMLCQVDLHNFFYLKQEEQRAILDKALQLEKVSLYGKILKEACLGHNDIVQSVQTAKDAVGNVLKQYSCNDSDSTEIKQALDKLKQLRSIYSGYITKKLPGRNCEQEYKQAELEWQMLGIQDIDLEQFYRTKERLLQLQSSYKKVENNTVYKNSEELLEKWSAKYELFLKQEPKCDVSMSWVKQTLADYERWNKANADLRDCDWVAIEKEFKEAEKERLAIAKPKGSAPSGDIKTLEEKHAKLKKKLTSWLEKKQELDNLDAFFEVLQIEHQHGCAACDNNRTYLEKLKSYRTDLSNYFTKVNNIDQATAEEKQLAASIDYLKQFAQYQTVTQRYDTAKATYDKAQRFMLEKQKWDKLIEQAQQYKTVLDDYEIWTTEHAVIKEKLNKYQASCDKKRIEKELKELENVYDQSSQGVECFMLYEKCKNELYNYKIAELDKEISQLEAKHIRLITHQEQYAKHLAILTRYSAIESCLTERLQTIKELESRFMGDKSNEGYKEWIYKEKVVPLINQSMNAFLEQFEQFTFKMLYKNKTFIYLLQDRGNEPTLDKASGYQNFIIGIGLRITLARLGAVGQQFKHLFIDEGFTACDTTNIAKIPQLLQSVMQYGEYKSILLMSHLENVRECASLVINLERKDPYSFIKFG